MGCGMPIISIELLKGNSVGRKREFEDVVAREASTILSRESEVVDIVFQEVEGHDCAKRGKLESGQ